MTRWAASLADLTAPALVDVGNPAGLNPLDIATGIVQGREPRPPLPDPPPVTAERLLENIMLPALSASGRCLVSFSGGRDSSWTLAVAVQAARREGLPDPVPVTLTYPEITEAQEDRWQEMVIRHLGLSDWERIPITDELEVHGPYAQRALDEVGLLFPANAYSLLPQLDCARDGWLILGIGASDFYMFWHWSQLSDLLALRRRPRRSDLPLLALMACPPDLRRRLLRRRLSGAIMPWVREPARSRAEGLLGEELAHTPVRFPIAMRRQRTHRCYGATQVSISALARSAGANVLMPHLQPEFLASIAREGGRFGAGDRVSSMRRMAGHLLPPEVLARRDGANMQRVLMGHRIREFADRWSGGGIDESMIDIELLRENWRSPRPDWRTTTLSQLALQHDIIQSAGTRTPASAPPQTTE